jgi:hypothetical protein
MHFPSKQNAQVLRWESSASPRTPLPQDDKGLGFWFSQRPTTNDESPTEPFLLFRGIVIQVLSQPSFDFCHRHPFAFVIIDHLIAVDLAEAEVSRFGMSEVEAAHT